MMTSLIARASKDDEQAFCELVSACQEEVFKLCYFYTGNEESGYNIAADSFRKIRNAISLYPDSEDFHLWMLRIVCNTCRASQYHKADSIPAIVTILRTRMAFSEKDIAQVLDLREEGLKMYDTNLDTISELPEPSGIHDLASGFRSSLKTEKQHCRPLNVLAHFRFTILAILIVLVMLLVARIQSVPGSSQNISSATAAESAENVAVTSDSSGQFLPVEADSEVS